VLKQGINFRVADRDDKALRTEYLTPVKYSSKRLEEFFLRDMSRSQEMAVGRRVLDLRILCRDSSGTWRRGNGLKHTQEQAPGFLISTKTAYTSILI
jgi:hypothetical protein